MKRKLAALLAVCLLLVSVPFTAMAEEPDSYGILKDYFENEPFAFYGNEATMSQLLALQVWNRVLDHRDDGNEELQRVYDANRDESGNPSILTGPKDIVDKMTVTAETDPAKKYFVFHGSSGSEYYARRYNASLKLKTDEIVANFTILQLQDKQDVVVESVSYEQGDPSTIDAYVVRLDGGPHDDPVTVGLEFGVNGPRVYGNGAMLNKIDVTSDTMIAAYHVTSEHMNEADPEGWWTTLNTGISRKLYLYEKEIRGVEIKRKTGSASAAWGFASCPVWLTDKDESADIFIGNTSVTITLPSVATGSIAVKRIDWVSPDDDPEHRVDLGPGYEDWSDEEYEEAFYEKVASISEDEANPGVYTVRFKSNYYTTVPLAVGYVTDDGAGVTEIACLEIHRVGLDLRFSRTNGDGIGEIMHGTDSSVLYKGGQGSYIVATYYYPNSDNTAKTNSDKQVQILAQLVWEDGRTEYRTVEAMDPWYYKDGSEEKEGTGFNYLAGQGTTALNDFILWEGEANDAPDQVYAFAIEKSGDEETFGGVKIGSDKGVFLDVALERDREDNSSQESGPEPQ